MGWPIFYLGKKNSGSDRVKKFGFVQDQKISARFAMYKFGIHHSITQKRNKKKKKCRIK